MIHVPQDDMIAEVHLNGNTTTSLKNDKESDLVFSFTLKERKIQLHVIMRNTGACWRIEIFVGILDS